MIRIETQWTAPQRQDGWNRSRETPRQVGSAQAPDGIARGWSAPQSHVKRTAKRLPQASHASTQIFADHENKNGHTTNLEATCPKIRCVASTGPRRRRQGNTGRSDGISTESGVLPASAVSNGREAPHAFELAHDLRDQTQPTRLATTTATIASQPSPLRITRTPGGTA